MTRSCPKHDFCRATAVDWVNWLVYVARGGRIDGGGRELNVMPGECVADAARRNA